MTRPLPLDEVSVGGAPNPLGIWPRAKVLLFVLTTLGQGAAPALSSAQEKVDCTNPQTQMAMNMCAQKAFEAADGDLNDTYQLSLDYMARLDVYLPANLAGAEEALRDAERAWIQYRNANCRAEGFAARGGSLEPLLVYSCLERLTRARTEELRALTEEN